MSKTPNKPHDAGSHDQPMTPAVQRVIDEADKRARDKAAMPAACPTATGCREHGCHGACMSPELLRELLPPERDCCGTFVGSRHRATCPTSKTHNAIAEPPRAATEE